MYDTKPLIFLKNKKNPGISSFVSFQQVWKQKETEETGSREWEDVGMNTHRFWNSHRSDRAQP